MADDGSEAVLYVRLPQEVKQRLDAHFPARKRAPWVRDLLMAALDQLDEHQPDFDQLSLNVEGSAA